MKINYFVIVPERTDAMAAHHVRGNGRRTG